MAGAVYGKDVFISVLQDGEPVNVISCVSFEETEESDIARHSYVGQVVTRRSKVHMGFSGTFEVENTDKGLEELQQAFLDAYLSGVPHPDVCITSVSYYDDGTRQGYVYTGVVLKFTKSTGGKDEVQTIRAEWEAEEKRPLQ